MRQVNCFLFLFLNCGWAQQPPRMTIRTPEFEKIAAGQKAWILADTQARYQAKELLAHPEKYPFAPAGTEKPNYGYTDAILGKQELQQVFEQWKGDRKQIDDVPVVGLKVEKEVLVRHAPQNVTSNVL
ncbi:MAG: hypothetical protein KatS3mg033_1075 [Thermonema sp.]|uniref:hypothetical protein n=1 Tax=Thermonema sp. TaxID=2231181 RepID=UPI0021DD0B94|nr:hypothetical protein [Thermonema sp.]GIV39275.1 MAG: hypothetical protein KatS3mg033_1075 [Thermonema sp.]